MSKNMTCEYCESEDRTLSKFPLKISEVLEKEFHEEVLHHICPICKNNYLGIAVQAYDDTLSWWVIVDDDEIKKIKSLVRADNFMEKVQIIVESKGRHIYGAHDGKYYIKNESPVVMLGMPPW